MVATLTSLTAHLSFINWSTQAWRLTSSSPHFPFHRFSGSNCSVLMCISRLLGPITWGKIWTLLYSLSFRLRTPSLARSLDALPGCTAHHPNFATTSLWGYRILWIGIGIGIGIWKPRIAYMFAIRVSCQLFRHTYSRRHSTPKIRVNRLPPPCLCWRVQCYLED